MRKKFLGKFIIIEGIDGAGSETQSKLLINFLKKKKIPVEKLTYPDYKGPIGKLIHQFLHKEHDFTPEIQFFLYFTDFLKDREKIERWKKQGKTIIADRYFTTTLGYQCQKGFPLKKALKIAAMLELPKPDIVVYLKISPETSIKRKLKEKKSLDRHEVDKKFLTKLTKFYQKLIKEQVFSRWVVVDGEKPIKEVFKQVKEIYEKYS
jgi:dTMP kinase